MVVVTIEAEIFAQLDGFAGLSALVGNRIFPNHLPQNVEMPAVSFFLVGAERTSSMGVDDGIVRSLYQVDAWSGKHQDDTSGGYDEMRSVAEQIRLALRRWRTTSGTIVLDTFFQNAQDLYEDIIDTHRGLLEFEIIYRE